MHLKWASTCPGQQDQHTLVTVVMLSGVFLSTTYLSFAWIHFRPRGQYLAGGSTCIICCKIACTCLQCGSSKQVTPPGEVGIIDHRRSQLSLICDRCTLVMARSDMGNDTRFTRDSWNDKIAQGTAPVKSFDSNAARAPIFLRWNCGFLAAFIRSLWRACFASEQEENT